MCYCTPNLRTPFCKNCHKYIESLQAELAQLRKAHGEPAVSAELWVNMQDAEHEHKYDFAKRAYLAGFRATHPAPEEVEQLRAEVDELSKALMLADDGRNYANELLTELRVEIEQLRAENERLNLGWMNANHELREIGQQLAEVTQQRDEAIANEGKVCDDCDGSGWRENRIEGRYACTCMTEAEPYQLLQDQFASTFSLLEEHRQQYTDKCLTLVAVCEKLLASQHYAEQLRQALIKATRALSTRCKYAEKLLHEECSNLLSIPNDTSALDQFKAYTSRLRSALEALPKIDITEQPEWHCSENNGVIWHAFLTRYCKEALGYEVTHNKTGNIYLVIGEATNATNAQEGQQMVLYERDNTTFVREAHEFWGKFIPKDKIR